MPPVPAIPSLAAASGTAIGDLVILDAAVARREGPGVAVFDANGQAFSADGSRYTPTRDPAQAMRLMDKYVRRLARLPHTWIAIGENGRSEVGATAMIAACKVAINRASESA